MLIVPGERFVGKYIGTGPTREDMIVRPDRQVEKPEGKTLPANGEA